MLFIALMSLTTTAVASIAAFFSVYGLAHTFTGAFWSVVAMGSALEAGKLMLASFVYRFRDVVGWRIKIPAYTFILSLMIVTSTGIYGYLSAAYQNDAVGMKEVVATLELKKTEQADLQKRKTEIDQQVSQLPTNDVRGRQRLMKQFDGESKQVNERLTAVTKDIQELSQKQIQAEAHIGPIMYLARIIGTDADNAIGILMIMIIIAFDPLAMLLTIATNIAIERHKAKKSEPYGVLDELAFFDTKKMVSQPVPPEYLEPAISVLNDDKEPYKVPDEDPWEKAGWKTTKVEIDPVKAEGPYSHYNPYEVYDENGKSIGVRGLTQPEIGWQDPVLVDSSWEDPIEFPPGAVWKKGPPDGEGVRGISREEAEERGWISPGVPVTEVTQDIWHHHEVEEGAADADKVLDEILATEIVPELELEPIPEETFVLYPVAVEDPTGVPLDDKEVVTFEINFNQPEDVVPESEIPELNPIEEIKQIETELVQKVEKTPEEVEMQNMIEKFFKRQELIRTTRRM